MFLFQTQASFVTSSPTCRGGGFLSPKANHRFSFDDTSVSSISELSPCAPRFFLFSYHSRFYIYKTHPLIPDIDCCIDIPVMIHTAFRADSFTNTQVLCFGILIAADIAQLTTCKETAYLYELFSLFFQFIFQKIYKHPPTVIRNGSSKVQ